MHLAILTAATLIVLAGSQMSSIEQKMRAMTPSTDAYPCAASDSSVPMLCRGFRDKKGQDFIVIYNPKTGQARLGPMSAEDATAGSVGAGREH